MAGERRGGAQESLIDRWLAGNWCEWEPLAKEVRAMLAVVKAAEKAGPYLADADDLRMGRALARLDRARRSGGAGRAGR
jgi:hypothetical protein